MGQAQGSYYRSERLLRAVGPISLKRLSSLSTKRFHHKLKAIPLIFSAYVLLWLLLAVFSLNQLWPLLALPIMMSAWCFYEIGALTATGLAAAILLETRVETNESLLVGAVTFAALGLLLGWAQRRQRATHRLTLKSSLVDSLTGLYNYGHFMACLEREIRRVDRYGGSLTLIMFDLDYFKNFNDRFGHQAGNWALEAVGATLQREKRQSDIAARFGGEEFVLLLPGGELAGFETAGRLRRAIAQIQVPIGGGATTGITASAGVASYPSDAASTEELLDCVDKLLYLSKRRGRNRVSAASYDSRERHLVAM